MANRKDDGRFAPGISGNPGGRPKLPAEMKEIFQAKGPEAAEILVKHLHQLDLYVLGGDEFLRQAFGLTDDFGLGAAAIKTLRD